TLIEQLQTACNMWRRRLDSSAANFARSEARTQVRLLNVDGDLGPALRRRQLRLDRPQRQIVECRSLARHAIVIHRVGTVGRDIHLEDGVVAFSGNTFDRNARKGKFVRKPAVVDREVNEVAQPMGRDFHLRKRQLRATSFGLRATSIRERLLEARSSKLAALTQTAPETAHRPERTAEYHPRHISESQSAPRPCRRRIPKLLLHRNPRSRTHLDRPCRTPATRSIRWPCSCGRERRRARPCRRRKCN